MQMKIIPIKRALISVSDKTGIADFAAQLQAANVEIISTGGTSQTLKEAGIPHLQAEDITGLPEMLDGRVKTLHPLIHGGILGKRDKHAEEANKHGIQWIDLVVVNFYPFTDVVNHQTPQEKAVEYIDIGGPTMVRAAAKNFAWVAVVTDPADYADVVRGLQEQGGLSLPFRQQLAEKAFSKTSYFDAMVTQYFAAQREQKDSCPIVRDLQLEKVTTLRYGENPHQQACAYRLPEAHSGILAATQHQGKELSYNNILDADAALACVAEFTQPACVIVKHANPCGAACASTIDEAYQKAYAADSLSAFGGIVALNRPCTKTIAEAITSIFMEVVIAPSFTEDALAVFAAKPNLRVLSLSDAVRDQWEMRFIAGGVLCQERDTYKLAESDLQVVTKAVPTDENKLSMLFAWHVLKHVKSNGILLAKQGATVGIGAGQVSRIDAVEQALKKAAKNATDTVLASDAFFPFRDSIDRLAGTGVRAIIQPGGSVRDEEVIAACNEHGIAMVFTGKRCFRH
jgi:phosphoribosylaminoimidazolecarboxamide formyltransferase/IMP cyclohydrolase